MSGIHQFLNMALLVAVAIVTFPSTTGFTFSIPVNSTQNPSSNQNAGHMTTESIFMQSASNDRSCDLEVVQSPERIRNVICPIEPSNRQSPAAYRCIGYPDQSNEWLQHCFGEANHQNSFFSGAHSGLLGTCSPEITAALEELMQEGLQSDEEKCDNK